MAVHNLQQHTETWHTITHITSYRMQDLALPLKCCQGNCLPGNVLVCVCVCLCVRGSGHLGPPVTDRPNALVVVAVGPRRTFGEVIYHTSGPEEHQQRCKSSLLMVQAYKMYFPVMIYRKCDDDDDDARG